MGDVPGDAASGGGQQRLVVRRLWHWLREVPRSGTLLSDFHTFTAFPWWPNGVLCNKWKHLLIHFSYYLEKLPHFPSARAHFHKHLVNLVIQGTSGREGEKDVLHPPCCLLIGLWQYWSFNKRTSGTTPDVLWWYIWSEIVYDGRGISAYLQLASYRLWPRSNLTACC